MDKSAWIKAFADTMMGLRVRAQRDQMEALAGELQAGHASEDPIAVAKSEWDAWPPHDD